MSHKVQRAEPWWKGAVVYHIYPRSFQDSNDDGIGDLPGLLHRLDYIAALGVDAIWLSPIFPSPMKDFGYDVANYTDVDPVFGTLRDFDELLAQAHSRGLRVIVDLVLNHTSDEHPWFRDSQLSRSSAKADWYLWADGEPGQPPNNWCSYFGGSAWQWHQGRGQYYLALFAPEQPDLNWRCPEVRQAIFEVVRFWLDRGVDGFRLDVVNFFIKDALLRDEPARRTRCSPMAHRNFHSVFRRDRPETLLLVEELAAIVDRYSGRVTIGEVSTDLGVSQYFEYSKPGRLDLVFNFALKNTPRFDAGAFYDGISRAEEIYGELGWPCWVLGNHDTRRLATRFSEGPLDERRAAVLMAMLLTLRGTPFLYYGDEIGMREACLARERLLDPKGRTLWPHDAGRDGCRTPMQWDDSRYAGFSSTEPWLPVQDDKAVVNVASAAQDPASLLELTRALLRLRKGSRALRLGSFAWLSRDPVDALGYERRDGDERKAVILSWRASPVSFGAAAGSGLLLRVLLGSHRQSGEELRLPCELAPYEVIIAEVR